MATALAGLAPWLVAMVEEQGARGFPAVAVAVAVAASLFGVASRSYWQLARVADLVALSLKKTPVWTARMLRQTCQLRPY